MNNKQDQQLQGTSDAELASRFPVDFLWGAATSAYQIEGATSEDGRGPSIWDRFAATPGRTFQGETGEVAADHYHRMEQDVALMAEMGLRAYRFSIAWSRIFPTGTGEVNQRGLDFYDRLVDTLLAHHIQPVATLFHWDLPAALQDQGGWTNRATAYAFADYAACVVEHLGDRVSRWITHNEPWCSAYLGYGLGIHAPGIQDVQAAATAAHHILLSHGLAVPRLRTLLPPTAQIGISLNLFPVYSVDQTPGASERVEREIDFRNRWFLDPVFKGRYPADLFSFMGCRPPEIQPGDLELISAPLNFLGINYYNPLRVGMTSVKHKKGGVRHDYDVLDMSASVPSTAMGWEIYAQGLTDLISWLRYEYVIPAILITENGAAFDDCIEASGRIADVRRLQYLREHIEAIGRSIQQSDLAPVQGYFAWSLLDNFEWAEGYSKRFGLVYIDYDTQTRIIKDSGLWYASFLALHNA